MEPNKDTFVGPSFSLQNRLGRVLWGIFYLILFRPSPRFMHGWRAFLLRLFGAKLGKHVHVYPSARIWAPWNLEVGDRCGIGDRAIVYSQGPIKIGSNVVVSQGVHLCAGSHSFEEPGFPLITNPISLEDDVWLAAEVFVHPGVTVGRGSVVSARSVVVKDLEPWKVYSGFPAQVIRDRNED